MDGLTCKEVLLSETYAATDYFRLEAEYYNATSFNYAKMLKGRDVEARIQYGTSCFCDEIRSEYPVLRLNELHNGFITTPQKYCHMLSSDDFAKLKLQKNDVLVVRTNGNPDLVGRAAVVMEDVNYAFASYLYRVVPNERISSTTLVAYLNCKYGRYEINKNSVKGNQTNFSPAKFRDICIPDFSSNMQREIQALYVKAYQLRQTADIAYSDAEQSFLKSIGVLSLKPNQDAFSIKCLSESLAATGRLDAEYYQPKYDFLFDALKKIYTKPLGGLDGIVSIKKSIEPGSSVYCADGIPFVRVSDMTRYGITTPEICLPHEIVPDVESLYPRKDTILFSKDGSIGIAYKVEVDTDIITSGALLHLTIKNPYEVLSDYLTLVLNSTVVQLQAERDSSGAIIQHWKPSEIEEVVIPILNIDVQEEIAEKVETSFALRHQSEQMLEYAKQAIEMAIEQGENAAIEWLNERPAQQEG